MTTLTDTQREWIDGARNLIDFLEAKPELIPAYNALSVLDYTSADELPALLASLGAGTKEADDMFIGVRRSFGQHSIKVYASRSNVCERVEVGTEEVEEEIAGDAEVPEGATVVGTTMRQVIRRMVPKYEVKCPPSLLAAGGAS